jgi:hypothetical protein
MTGSIKMYSNFISLLYKDNKLRSHKTVDSKVVLFFLLEFARI